MVDDELGHILTINSGSSSIKFAVFHMGPPERCTFLGQLERIGSRSGAFKVKDAGLETIMDRAVDLPDHDAALNVMFHWLHSQSHVKRLDAVGHRVVHGGTRYTHPHLVTPELVASLRELVPLAPNHLPHELDAIEAADRAYPSRAQVACFDTAFHRAMPRLAQMYALPRALFQEGVVRYGFHGLSYEYIMHELNREAGPEVANGRVVIAHLGNGASMAAVRNGQSVDTTMGFTPAGGLMMSTRSGDLDPGVLLYLIRQKGLNAERAERLVNQEGGLLGVSGISSDMRDLMAREAQDSHAAEAVGLFCHLARKHLGSLAAILGGLDTLVFTAGIGENAPTIRSQICKDLDFLGIHVDPRRNDTNAPIISPDGNPVTIRVLNTNEELMIARHTVDLLRRPR
jgi:acetate kinase